MQAGLWRFGTDFGNGPADQLFFSQDETRAPWLAEKARLLELYPQQNDGVVAGEASGAWVLGGDVDFEGGEVFRSGCTFRRGKGKIFYFRPGHETFPIYHNANVRRVVANGVAWAAPSGATYFGEGRNIPEPLSPISTEHIVDESLHRAK